MAISSLLFITTSPWSHVAIEISCDLRRRLQRLPPPESINNLTPADVYFGRAANILAERERIKRQTIANCRLQHRLQAA